MVMCKIKGSLDIVKIAKAEFDSNRDMYDGSTKGMVSVINKTGKRVIITSEEYKTNKEQYTFHRSKCKTSKSSYEQMMNTRTKKNKDGLSIDDIANRKKIRPVIIYNNLGEIMYISDELLMRFLKRHNLPTSLSKSLNKNNMIGQTNIEKIWLNKYNHLNYIGWYARYV